MFPFLALDGNTKIIHLEMFPDGKIKVYIEKQGKKDGFHNRICFLSGYV